VSKTIFRSVFPFAEAHNKMVRRPLDEEDRDARGFHEVDSALGIYALSSIG